MSRKATTLNGYGHERTVISDPPCNPKHKAKKDTKRWCRGKVGTEHEIKRVPWDEYHWPANTPQGAQRLKEWREHAAAERAAGRRGFLVGDITDLLICKNCGRRLGSELRAPQQGPAHAPDGAGASNNEGANL